MIKYYNRKTKDYEIENVAGNRSLSLIYEKPVLKLMLPKIASRKIYSDIYGRLCDTKFSSKYVKGFISQFKINMDEYEKDASEFKSFNDFFYRKVKADARPIDMTGSHFISPCDSRLLVIENIGPNSTFNLKGFEYSLRDLIQDDSISSQYKNGSCLIFRLCPTDYHRFHFIDSGMVSKIRQIKGRYYSVNPIALENIKNVFGENKREYCIQNTDNFGDIIYLDVGATFVGSIIQTYKEDARAERGSERGYFKFGGSTVVVFVKEGVLKVDDDILEESRKGIETKVRMGEKIGCSYNEDKLSL